ncbi:MAG: exodeoxyribonuclease VII large subunit [Candidatus Puniceispirillales bacterium WSBS_2018_MAG_OTU23]
MIILHSMQDEIPPPPSADNNPILSLGELSQSLKKTVESVFDQVRVRAEVSRPTRPGSGHIYFTLKDDSATLDAVCWKAIAPQLSVQPEEGLEVIATGKLTTYPGRSKYQIIIKELELAGEGALLKQLEERKQRLTAEGLFDPTKKQKIPAMPLVVGVITSPTGAVIRDILHRLGERFPVHVIVWPVLVQGASAGAEITAAINGFDALKDMPSPPVPVPDIVIVARGGGALEDLMAFNEENVVRAVAACRLPLISAVGHETDTTLIDFAADLRAPTPTAAAELATPVKADLLARLNDLETRLSRNLTQRMEASGQHLRNLHRALADPDMAMSSKHQQLDITAEALSRHLDNIIRRGVENLRQYDTCLPTPIEQITALQTQVAMLSQRMCHWIDAKTSFIESRLEQASRLLEASSFQKVLSRGFALVTGADGQVMRQAEQYGDGEDILIRLSHGQRKAVLGEVAKSIKNPKKSNLNSNPNSNQGDLF